MPQNQFVSGSASLFGHKGAAWQVRLMLNMLKRLRQGRLKVILPNKETRRVEGDLPGPRGELSIKSPRLLWKLLRNGEVGFGEAYMRGDWDSPDLTALLQLLALNEPYIFGGVERTNLLVHAWRGLGHWLRSNTRRGSRRNIAHHYDLGNDFYRLWLDQTMTYSCGVFKQRGESLVQSQYNKFELILDRLELQPHHHLLEVGCGWGGFALYAAETTGCRVTGITLSKEQLSEARRLASQRGLQDRVSFELLDYRDLRGSYDRVVSIEMYEAVGKQYWPLYFRRLHEALVPGGRAVIQGITMDAGHYRSYARTVDFIQAYIFPGGRLATKQLLAELAAGAGFQTDTPDCYGQDYAETLAEWHRRVRRAHEAIVSRSGERFYRMWRYYLAYCECGFRIGRVDLVQLGLHKPAR